VPARSAAAGGEAVLQLRPFTADLAAVVASWPASAGEAAWWCGHTGGPVTAVTVAEWAGQDAVHPFGLHAGNRLVGYGELWVDDEAAEVELARLIVAPDQRGRGVGRMLVAELLARARAAYPDVFLRVHPGNGAALRCYAAAGLVRVSPEQEARWNVGQPTHYVWLACP
jgi:ribosomal protein S18 acetylase RimI-like enzyme